MKPLRITCESVPTIRFATLVCSIRHFFKSQNCFYSTRTVMPFVLPKRNFLIAILNWFLIALVSFPYRHESNLFPCFVCLFFSVGFCMPIEPCERRYLSARRLRRRGINNAVDKTEGKAPISMTEMHSWKLTVPALPYCIHTSKPMKVS